MTRYSDGNIFAVPTTRIKLGLNAVSLEHISQSFHLVLLNRGANLITIFFTPLLGKEEVLELPPSSPGVVLDGLSYEKLYNGIEAIASVGVTNLMVNLYSNDITYGLSEAFVNNQAIMPIDTYKYPELRK